MSFCRAVVSSSSASLSISSLFSLLALFLIWTFFWLYFCSLCLLVSLVANIRKISIILCALAGVMKALPPNTTATTMADAVVVVKAVAVAAAVKVSVVLVVRIFLTQCYYSSSLKLKIEWNGSLKRKTLLDTFSLSSRNHSTTKCHMSLIDNQT